MILKGKYSFIVSNENSEFCCALSGLKEKKINSKFEIDIHYSIYFINYTLFSQYYLNFFQINRNILSNFQMLSSTKNITSNSY